MQKLVLARVSDLGQGAAFGCGMGQPPATSRSPGAFQIDRRLVGIIGLPDGPDGYPQVAVGLSFQFDAAGDLGSKAHDFEKVLFET